MRKYPIREIEEMDEPFSGVRRRNTIPLSDAHPEVAAEWLYEKNAGWGPESVTRASGVRCWWRCSICQREYKAQVCNRTSGQKSACPYCASKRVCDDNALAVFYPSLAKEWHPTKNKKLKFTDVMRASNKRAWWLCRVCSHEWQCAIDDRTIMESGCPACYEARMEQARLHPQRNETPQIVLSADSEPSRSWYEKPSSADFVSLYDFSKRLASEWHPIKNGKITARDIAKGSDAMAWWRCRKGADHEWQAVVYSRTGRKSGCPFCNNRKLSVTNSLAKKNPKLAKEWHPVKNGKLKPADVVAGGRQKYWWQCKVDSSHEWEAQIDSRMSGCGCPDCAHTRVSKQNCLSNEFPYIAAQLHPAKNAEITGDNIAAMSSRKVWWKCAKGPDHEWQATPANRTGRGSGCPFCAGKQLSVISSLAALFPKKTEQWDKKKNGKLRPEDFSPHSKEVVWWICAKKHRWQQSIQKRVRSPISCWECTGVNSPGSKPKAYS